MTEKVKNKIKSIKTQLVSFEHLGMQTLTIRVTLKQISFGETGSIVCLLQEKETHRTVVWALFILFYSTE